MRGHPVGCGPRPVASRTASLAVRSVLGKAHWLRCWTVQVHWAQASKLAVRPSRDEDTRTFAALFVEGEVGVAVSNVDWLARFSAVAVKLDDREPCFARLEGGTERICEACRQPIPATLGGGPTRSAVRVMQGRRAGRDRGFRGGAQHRSPLQWAFVITD